MITLNEFRKLNNEKGLHWFDKDTLLFFSSRVTNWDSITGYFISSEKPPLSERHYTIRKADIVTGNVDTIGQFGQYKTLSQAKTALKLKLKGK